MNEQTQPPRGQPMQPAVSPGLANVGKVLEKIQETIGERRLSHGDPGCFAEVFAGMLRPYMQGLMYAARPFLDVDAFAVLEIIKLARRSVAPRPSMEHPLDSAIYGVLSSAYLWSPMEKTGEYLFNEMLNSVGGDRSKLEGITFPDHWTMAEGRRYMEFMRNLEKQEMEYEQRMKAEMVAEDARQRFNHQTERPNGLDHSALEAAVSDALARHPAELPEQAQQGEPATGPSAVDPSDPDVIAKARREAGAATGAVEARETAEGPVDTAEPGSRPVRRPRVP
jgi:hypothetical protein